jgi:putative transposase
MAESFFATLECELLDRHIFHTRAQARLAVFDFIEAFYNTERRHSSLSLPSLGMLSPAQFKLRWFLA